MHVTPTEVDPNFTPEAPVVLSITARKPEAIASQFRPESIVSQAEDQIRVRLTAGAQIPPESPDPFLGSTFYVDFDSDPVRDLIEANQGDARPSIDELVAWTRGAIEPSADRATDSASVVATVGRGDCTEHAVLFTALARSFGYPTAIALGIVVVRSENGEVGAFGHAWTEVFDEGQWKTVDPSPLDPIQPLGYLREGLMLEEGPGYTLELLRIHRSAVRAVRVTNDTPSP